MNDPKWKDYRNSCNNFKFLICALMYQSYLRQIIYGFQIQLLLLVYKVYSVLFLFWIQ